MQQANDTSNVTTLPTEKQIADELKASMRPHLEALCKLMDGATKQQLGVSFQLGINAYGQRFIQDLTVVKVL